MLNGSFEVHALRLRAAPRARSDVCATTCIRRARSPGLSLTCSISRLRSTPNSLAASTFPPGTGLRRRSMARARLEAVSSAKSFTTSSYRLTYRPKLSPVSGCDLLTDVKTAVILLAVCLPLAAEVKISQEQGRIAVEVDGKPFTTFYYGPDTMKPYLHPLRTASGKIVTRQWPMEKNIPGESHDHPHHTGLWFTHGDVNGLDFWANLQKGPKFGQVVVDKIQKVKSGKRSGTIEGTFNWLDPSGKPLLREHRIMTFSSDPKTRTIDFDITLTALEPVKFGDTKEGTFAVRLADAIAEKGGTGTLTNAIGATGMKNVWGKPSPWVDYAGTLDGEEAGIAIFDHPSNPRHPTTWHARDYGLFAANIFGLHDFTSDKSKDGSMSLDPGKSLRFRYRVYIHPGKTADAKLAEEYRSYVGAK